MPRLRQIWWAHGGPEVHTCQAPVCIPPDGAGSTTTAVGSIACFTQPLYLFEGRQAHASSGGCHLNGQVLHGQVAGASTEVGGTAAAPAGASWWALGRQLGRQLVGTGTGFGTERRTGKGSGLACRDSTSCSVMVLASRPDLHTCTQQGTGRQGLAPQTRACRWEAVQALAGPPLNAPCLLVSLGLLCASYDQTCFWSHKPAKPGAVPRSA